MSLDVYLEAVRPTTVYRGNITHNLGAMAKEAGLYEALWRPEELDGVAPKVEFAAYRLMPRLVAGLDALKAEPERFRKLNPTNGWGSYEGLVAFVEDYIMACEQNPDAKVGVSR